MKAPVIAQILHRNPAKAPPRPKKPRLTGRWKPNGRRAIVCPSFDDVDREWSYLAFVVRDGETLKCVIGSRPFVEKHLRMLGLDRSALWVEGSAERMIWHLVDRFPHDKPVQFIRSAPGGTGGGQE